MESRQLYVKRYHVNFKNLLILQQQLLTLNRDERHKRFEEIQNKIHQTVLELSTMFSRMDESLGQIQTKQIEKNLQFILQNERKRQNMVVEDHMPQNLHPPVFVTPEKRAEGEEEKNTALWKEPSATRDANTNQVGSQFDIHNQRNTGGSGETNFFASQLSQLSQFLNDNPPIEEEGTPYRKMSDVNLDKGQNEFPMFGSIDKLISRRGISEDQIQKAQEQVSLKQLCKDKMIQDLHSEFETMRLSLQEQRNKQKAAIEASDAFLKANK